MGEMDVARKLYEEVIEGRTAPRGSREHADHEIQLNPVVTNG